MFKLTESGYVFATGEQVPIIEEPQIEVVDKTGADDAFTAGYDRPLFEGKSTFEYAHWALPPRALP